MKEQIQQLIAAGQTKDALELLVKMNPDALLLQAQYNNGEKQFNLGLVEFSEWQRIQSRVNFAALEMAGKGTTPPPPPPPTSTVAPPSNSSSTAVNHKRGEEQSRPRPDKPKAFISYNHGDDKIARRVRDFLEKNEIDVLIDQDDMPAGMSIMEFIQESIKNANAVVSIVSSKSLQSGWVGQESVASMYAVWLADKKFIPVKLDDVAFDIDFQITAQKNILQKIQDMETKIGELRQLGGDSRAFDDDRNRLFELKNNLGQIIQRFRNVLMLDISGSNFEPSMRRVLAAIQAS